MAVDNLIGPLLLLYVIISSFMAWGCQYYEVSHREKIERGLRLYFILGWPTLPLLPVYLNLSDRYERWQLKRVMRRLFTKISGAVPDDATLQRAMERVLKAVDDL